MSSRYQLKLSIIGPVHFLFKGCWVYLINPIFSSPEPKAQGELIVWDSSQRPSVRVSVRPCVHTFKH